MAIASRAQTYGTTSTAWSISTVLERGDGVKRADGMRVAVAFEPDRQRGAGAGQFATAPFESRWRPTIGTSQPASQTTAGHRMDLDPLCDDPAARRWGFARRSTIIRGRSVVARRGRRADAAAAAGAAA
jgi:hypothetical protein